MKRFLIATVAALSSLAASAVTAPLATIDADFEELASVGVVGADSVNADNTLYWMFESSGTWLGQAVNSWLLVWDPLEQGTVSGTVSFSQSIVQVFGSQQALMASDRFEAPGYVYDYSNPAISLEPSDRALTSFAGGVISFTWTGRQPGDVVRVLTAVPEPGTWALMALGLLATGSFVRSRRVS